MDARKGAAQDGHYSSKEVAVVSKEVRIKITPEGKVEIDSSIFEDCKDVAKHLSDLLGKVEKFEIKEDHDVEERIKIEKGD